MKTTHEKLRALVLSAALIALSIVLTRLASINVGEVYRFGFGKLPVVFASIYLGPLPGLAVGALSDIIGAILTTGCNPLFTIPAAFAGVLPWCFLVLLDGKKTLPRVLTATVFARVITSGMMLTLLLAYVCKWFTPISKFWTMLSIRTLTALVESTVEGVVVYLINKALK